MKRIFAFILFISFPVIAQEELAVLGYPRQIFDSDTCCWRSLARNGQYEQAGKLIRAYLKVHKNENVHSLNWHAGQMFAKSADNKQAVKYCKKTYSFFYLWFGGHDAKAWYYYGKGTVAFIKRDKKCLARIIAAWDRRLPKDKNYQQLVLLLGNWDKSYLEALK